MTFTRTPGNINAPVTCGGTGTNRVHRHITSTCSPNITASDNGATITFNATAEGGSTFDGRSNAASASTSTCTGTTDPCSLVFGANGALTVTFSAGTTATSTAVNACPATSPSTRPRSATRRHRLRLRHEVRSNRNGHPLARAAGDVHRPGRDLHSGLRRQCADFTTPAQARSRLGDRRHSHHHRDVQRGSSRSTVRTRFALTVNAPTSTAVDCEPPRTIVVNAPPARRR